MIFAIEGPDGCGKTTLVAAVRAMLGSRPVVCIPKSQLSPALHAHANEAMRREIVLFGALYDPSRAYLSERFFSVTGPVYADVYRRGPLDEAAPWEPETTVFHLDVSESELGRRLRERGDATVDAASLSAVVAAYERRLAAGRYARVISLDGREPVEESARRVLASVDQWLDGHPRLDLPMMLETQRMFNERLQRARYRRGLADMTAAERNDAVKTTVLSTIAELVELLDHANWKMHRRDRPVDHDKVVEELVDAFKYLLNFFLYVPVTADEFARAFAAKSAAVERRLDREFQ